MLKPDGRKVWTLSGDIGMDANELIEVLTDPLGSTDPVKYQRAMKAAIRLAQKIGTSANEIDRICELAAKRGTYGGSDE